MAGKVVLVRPSLIYVDWDIACTESGPVLLEDDDDAGVHIIQDRGSGLLDQTMREDLRKLQVNLGQLHR